MNATTTTNRRPPECCARCKTPIAKWFRPQDPWYPCVDCDGEFCEPCCDAEKTVKKHIEKTGPAETAARCRARNWEGEQCFMASGHEPTGDDDEGHQFKLAPPSAEFVSPPSPEPEGLGPEQEVTIQKMSVTDLAEVRMAMEDFRKRILDREKTAFQFGLRMGITIGLASAALVVVIFELVF